MPFSTERPPWPRHDPTCPTQRTDRLDECECSGRGEFVRLWQQTMRAHRFGPCARCHQTFVTGRLYAEHECGRP